MEYSSLTKDQQKQILEGRLAGWEADHFGHTVNLLALEANGVSDAEKEQTLKALSTLEASIIAARAELDKFGNDDTSPV